MASRPKDSSNPSTAQVLPLGAAPEDALRAMLQSLIQETLEREFTQFLGAAPYARTETRRGLRNGRRRRRFLTRVGPLELRVPRDRAGRFQPSLFARYQRSEQALVFRLDRDVPQRDLYPEGERRRRTALRRDDFGLRGERVGEAPGW